MSDEAGVARADCVVSLGARLVADGDPLSVAWRAALLATSRLSPEGVALAMSHLETSQSHAEREAFHARTKAAPAAHLVLSGNVCTAALRAIALAVAGSASVFVKPSRRDPELARLIVGEIGTSPDFAGKLELVDAIAPAEGDTVFAYGSNETLTSIRDALPSGVGFVGHGHGLGVGWVGEADHGIFDADALARDVVVFDQAGCLSPRVVLVEGTEDEVTLLGRRVASALALAERRVPRGEVDLGGAALYTRALRSVGEVFEGEGYVVGVDLSPEALTVPPPARILHVVRASAAHAARLIEPIARFVTTVGTAAGREIDPRLSSLVSAFCPGARMTHFGAMQRPPLDGPVDLRAD